MSDIKELKTQGAECQGPALTLPQPEEGTCALKIIYVSIKIIMHCHKKLCVELIVVYAYLAVENITGMK